MRYIEGEGRIVWSASDLKAAAECEFAWLRAIDARLGRVPAVVEPEDLTLARAGRLGGEHELRALAAYRAAYGERVVEIAAARSTDAAALAEAVARTNEALASDDVTVIYQAAFSTPDFVGFADFLVRDPSTGSGQVHMSPAAGSCRTPSSRGARRSPRSCSSRPMSISSIGSGCRAPIGWSCCSATAR